MQISGHGDFELSIINLNVTIFKFVLCVRNNSVTFSLFQDILVERFQFGHVCVGGWGQDGPIFYIKLYARRFGPVLILSGIDGIRWYGDVSGAGSSSFFSSLVIFIF